MNRMEENVKKTHKDAERQGLPRVMISRDAPLEDLPDYEDEKEPKEQEKQPEKERKIGL